MFGLIGALIHTAFAEGERVEADNRQKLLDRADSEDLLALADDGPQSFRAGAADLRGSSLEIPSFWSRLFRFGFDCQGLLRLQHETRGEFIVELLGQNVIRTASDKLPSVLGDRLEVRAAWDRQAGRFV